MAFLIAAGCSATTGETPYSGECVPLTVVGSDPPSDATGVSTSTEVALELSTYPDPDSVGVETLVLTSGFFRNPGAYRVDLIDKTIRFRPSTPLEPNLTYSVIVAPGIRSLAGCTLSGSSESELAYRTFRTGSDSPAPPVLAPVAFSAVLDVFRRSCAGQACHRADGPAGVCAPSNPPKGLSLCDDRAYDDLVAVPSVEVRRLLRVAPWDSSRSYLLHKLLPGERPDRPLPTVLGHGAVQPSGESSAELPDADLRAIADWIDSGAPR